MCSASCTILCLLLNITCSISSFRVVINIGTHPRAHTHTHCAGCSRSFFSRDLPDSRCSQNEQGLCFGDKDRGLKSGVKMILPEVSFCDQFSLRNNCWSEQLVCKGSQGACQFRRYKRRSGQEILSCLL